MAKITFHGAAGTVTGSKYLLEAGGAKVLIDCGMFQGKKKLRLRNWDPTPFKAKSLDAVALTHAHLDHTGFLPRVVKEGFNHKIFCTPATAKLAELILLDSAKIQGVRREVRQQKRLFETQAGLYRCTTATM